MYFVAQPSYIFYWLGCRNRTGLEGTSSRHQILKDQLTLSQIGGQILFPPFLRPPPPPRIFRPSYGPDLFYWWVESSMGGVPFVVWPPLYKNWQSTFEFCDWMTLWNIYEKRTWVFFLWCETIETLVTFSLRFRGQKVGVLRFQSEFQSMPQWELPIFDRDDLNSK